MRNHLFTGLLLLAYLGTNAQNLSMRKIPQDKFPKRIQEGILDQGKPTAMRQAGQPLMKTQASLPSLKMNQTGDVWEQTSGPFGGLIDAIAPTTNGYTFVCSYSVGVFRSSDNGNSWTKVNQGLGSYYTQCLGIDQNNNIYVGTDQDLYFSSDLGLNWSYIDIDGAISGNTYDVTALLVDGSNIFVGTSGSGIFASTDNGVSWAQVNTTTNYISAFIRNTNFVFAATWGDGVYRTGNLGATWTSINTGLTVMDVQSLTVNGAGNVFAGTYLGGVFVSTNNGLSWSALNNGLSSNDVQAIFMKKASGVLYAGTYDQGMFRSTNNGTNWTQINNNLQGNNIRALGVDGNGNLYAGCGGDGLFRITDATSNWTDVNNGLTVYVRSLVVNNNGDLFAGTLYCGVYRSTDNGNSWISLPSSQNRNYYSLLVNTNGWIFGATSAGVFRSQDNGLNWVQVNTGLTNLVTYGLAYNKNNNNLFVAGTGGVYRSGDNGNNWARIISGMADTLARSIVVSPVGPTFAGTYSDYPNANVYRSINDGGNWSAVNTGLDGYVVRVLAVGPNNNVYAGTAGGGVYRSTDNGGSWVDVNLGLGDTYVNSLVFDSDGNIFAGTPEYGVYKSVDNGDTWVDWNNGLMDWYVVPLAINVNDVLFAGTGGSGVFRLVQSGAGSGAPVISDFYPYDGEAGTSVTISGSGFSATNTDNIVYFGGARAQVTSSSATDVIVDVPAGSNYAPISVTVNGLTAYSSIPFMPTFNGGGGVSSSSLGQKVDFPAGTEPIKLVAGDLDQDGKMDVVTIGSSNTPRYLRNTSNIGTVSFASQNGAPLNNLPTDITLADIDGDGKLDLVISSGNDNTVSIFLNSSNPGAISFAGRIAVNTRTDPRGVAVADIDQDGKPDLLTIHRTNILRIIQNSSTIGNVSFTNYMEVNLVDVPIDIAVGDISGDMIPDVIIANGGTTKSISLYENTSTGTAISFNTNIDLLTGPNSVNQIKLVDLDMDQDLDIVAMNITDQKVSAFRNTTMTGVLTFDTRDDFPASTPSGFDIGDINGDGSPDVIVANRGTNNVTVYQNMSTSSMLGLGTRIDFATAAVPNDAVVFDVDGDGKPDVITANNSNTENSISVLRNTTTPSSGAPPPPNATAPSNVTSSSFIANWNTSSGANDYRLDVSQNINFTAFLSGYNDILVGNVTSYQVSGLIASSTYYYRVRAVGPGGTSGNSNVITVNTLSGGGGSLETPSSFTATAQSSSQINLQWFYSTTNIDGFKIDRSTDNFATFTQIATPGSVARAYTDNSGLSPSTLYYYRIQAYRGSDISPFATANATTPASGGNPPAAPTTTDASNVTSSSFTAQWTLVTDATNYLLDVATDAGFTALIMQNQNTTQNTYTVYGLNQMTTYHYRVRAQNANGTSGYSNVKAVTTTSGGGTPPNEPTGLQSMNVTSTGFTLTWNSSLNANDYRLDVSKNNNFSDYVSGYADLAVGNVTSHNVSNGITPSTTYYCRVRAAGPGGISSNSNTISVTTSSGGSQQGPQISHTPYTADVVVSNSTAQSVNITASVTDPDGLNNFLLKYRQTGKPSIQSISFSSFTNGTAQIPGNAFVSDGTGIGVDYRLEATNTRSLTNTTQWYSINVRNGNGPSVQPSFSWPKTDVYPSGEEQKAYRIFSVPYNLDSHNLDFLNTSLGQHAVDGIKYVNWRMQWIASNGTKIDYDDFKNNSICYPGTAFFLVIKNWNTPIAIDPGVYPHALVKASDMYNTGIQLTNGIGNWFLIGTPMNMTIPWDSLVFVGANVLDHAVYTGTGAANGWDRAVNQLDPWQGIAVKTTGQCTVKFKTGIPGTLPKHAVTPKMIRDAANAIPSSPNDWLVKINANRVDINMRCEGGGFGMRNGASVDYDPFDTYLPPSVGDKAVMVGFDGPNGPRLMDMRPLDANGGVWDMKLTTLDAGARVKLNFEGALNLPDPTFEVYLIDLEEKIAHNLKTTTSLVVGSGNGSKDFRIVAGKKAFVNQNNAGVDLHPSTMTLYTNYPNPFNPSTTIRYTVPNKSELYNVTLKIYNMLGQEIVTLVNSRQISGYYEVTWNAHIQSSGVYFYRLSVSDGIQTLQDVKKMMLVK